MNVSLATKASTFNSYQMNNTYIQMNPYYYDMASGAVSNATTYFNATAQDFFVNQWPLFTAKMDVFWARFQNDPHAWIALYPLSLFFMALVIWNMNNTRTLPQMSNDTDHVYEYNIMGRQRRVILVTPKKREDDHPMMRRSQNTRMYIRLE